MRRLAGWMLSLPALALVVLALILPVGATVLATLLDTAGYGAFFGSGFRRTVLWRTLEIASITTLISLAVAAEVLVISNEEGSSGMPMRRRSDAALAGARPTRRRAARTPCRASFRRRYRSPNEPRA